MVVVPSVPDRCCPALHATISADRPAATAVAISFRCEVVRFMFETVPFRQSAAHSLPGRLLVVRFDMRRWPIRFTVSPAGVQHVATFVCVRYQKVHAK